MWGGRFAHGQDARFARVNASLDVDKRLYREDIEGSRVHAAMLERCGLLSAQEFKSIDRELDALKEDIEHERLEFSPDFEDIHMTIEAALAARIGEAGKKLHTARSRNDQVALDVRLWLRKRYDEHQRAVIDLIKALLDRAESHCETLMPGFTHLQIAQPVTLGFHLCAYAFMLTRDLERLKQARTRMNESPLGAAAFAGTPYPIDRQWSAHKLGFDKPMGNACDAVSSRDFALDYVSTMLILALNLSRLAEEIVLWSSPLFGFIKLSDHYSTGSSIMPQKRNPDAAELIRAKPGEILGALNAAGHDAESSAISL